MGKTWEYIKNHNTWFFILAFLALNIFLKSLYLGTQEVDIDEPFSIYHAQSSLKDIFLLMPGENNPPLFFIILHYWIKLFGVSPVSARFLPMLFSSLSVIFIFLTGKRFANLLVAITASVLYTFSNLNIYHSHDTRVYSLFVLLATASMYFFFVFIETQKTKPLIWVTLCNILLGYAHFFGFFIVSLQFFAVFSFKQLRTRATIKKYLLSVGVHFLFYLPYMPVFFKRFFSSASNGTWVSKPGLSDLFQRLWMFSNGPENCCLFLLVIIMGVILVVLYRQRISIFGKLVIAWFIAPYVFMFVISYLVPMFLDKYLIYITPGFYLSIAFSIGYLYSFKVAEHAGIEKSENVNNSFKAIAGFFFAFIPRLIEKWRIPFGLMLSLLICYAMIRKTNLNYNHNRYPSQVVQLVKDNKSDSTLVLLCPAWIDLNIAYYYDIEIFKAYGQLTKKLNRQNIFPIYNAQNIPDSAAFKYSGALYIDGWSTLTDPDSSIYKSLEETFGARKLIRDFNGYKVFSFDH